MSSAGEEIRASAELLVENARDLAAGNQYLALAYLAAAAVALAKHVGMSLEDYINSMRGTWKTIKLLP